MGNSYTVILVILSIILVILATAKLRLNAFFSLITTSILLALFLLGPENTPEILKNGFGNTLGSIGLIIIFGTALGVLLEKSGATHGMANYILRLVRKEKSSRAIAITGTITGLPIFCDSGFIVLNGLNHSISRKSGIPLAKMAAILAISLYTLHCFIPPHPGITAAVGIMSADIGLMVILGTTIALPGIFIGYLWIRFISGRTKNLNEIQNKWPEEDVVDTPSPFLSFLPVLLPLLLISINSMYTLLNGITGTWYSEIITLAGNPAIALFIGILSVILIMDAEKTRQTDAYLVESIEKSGPILLITAAGGTFGAVIKATGVGEIFSDFLAGTNLGLLIPFLMALLLKTAQGSSTVAAITSASIITPMLPGLGMDTETGKIFALLALGAGTIAVSHTNDSFFWVVTKFSGIPAKLTLKLFSTATLVVSVSTFVMIYGLSFLI